MAVSYRTLSGCCVSLLIRFSYFLRRRPHDDKRTASAKSVAVKRITLRTIMNHPKSTFQQRDRGCIGRDFAHFPHGRFRVGAVKYSRTCDDPVTPGAHHVSQVSEMHPAI